MDFSTVDRLMADALTEGVFPGAVVLVFDREGIRFHEAYGEANRFSRQPMHRDTCFDLASLTKPLGTALAVAVLVAAGVVSFDDPIGRVLDPFRDRVEGTVTIRELLSHSGGFSDYKPFYLHVNPLRGCSDLQTLRRLLSRENLRCKPGRETVYSDIGFMILHWFVETVSSMRMDALLRQEVYGRIEGCGLCFNDVTEPVSPAVYAATEWCPWRCRLLVGQVHDENAWAFGGIGGHAGLFGRAVDIYRLLQRLMQELDAKTATPVVPRYVLEEMFQRFPPLGGRALGFDLPSAEGSSSGKWFSPESVGHLGFTGTSFWVDITRRIGVILLTNRVHPSRNAISIRRFRPILHDVVMQCLGFGGMV